MAGERTASTSPWEQRRVRARCSPRSHTGVAPRTHGEQQIIQEVESKGPRCCLCWALKVGCLQAACSWNSRRRSAVCSARFSRCSRSCTYDNSRKIVLNRPSQHLPIFRVRVRVLGATSPSRTIVKFHEKGSAAAFAQASDWLASIDARLLSKVVPVKRLCVLSLPCTLASRFLCCGRHSHASASREFTPAWSHACSLFSTEEPSSTTTGFVVFIVPACVGRVSVSTRATTAAMAMHGPGRVLGAASTYCR